MEMKRIALEEQHLQADKKRHTFFENVVTKQQHQQVLLLNQQMQAQVQQQQQQQQQRYWLSYSFKTGTFNWSYSKP